MTRDTVRAARAATLLAAVLVAACGGGDHIVSPPPAPGSLAVTVAADDGRPVEAAAVSVQNSAGAAVGSGVTDAAGAYQLSGLPAGTYTALVKVPTGFTPASSQKQAAVSNGTTATAAFSVQALKVDQATIGAGVTDSVALASGVVAQVAVPAGAGAVEVKLSQGAGPTLGGYEGVNPPVTLQVTTPGAPAATGASRALATAGTVTVTVWNRVPTCTGSQAEMAFQVGTTTGGAPLFVYSEPTCTTYSDPSTGRSGAAYLTTSEVPVGAKLDLVLFAKDAQCSGTERSLYPYPGTAGDDAKTPVILIHGWQWDRTKCKEYLTWEPGAATFGPLAQSINATLSGDYQVYVLRYPTMEHIANAVAFLRAEIVRHKWEARDVVLVGHSMGGLVGRGYVAAYGSEHVRALITLGTPHLGSPLADNGPALKQALHDCYGLLGDVGKTLFPSTDGYRDLSPASDWIQALRDQRTGADRIYTYGGETTSFPAQCVINHLVAGSGDTRNDGVVPLPSALPDWTTLQTLVPTTDHLQITGNTVVPVTNVLRQLAQCLPGTPPAPPAANGFPLSGTLARQTGGRIDVVLNPIVVDGTPVRGLTKSAFTVVENACLKPFEITTSEGNLGVDLVFIQDLSGSMSGAISGVRNSVLSFASTLASRGLNVRIGSVGFSGPGTITTHANESTCERVGPVQDLASAETFRAHVAASWYATGGCDEPENALEAVKYAHEHMTWRSGSARVYILITDVSIHTAADSCNSLGPCTDQTLESIVGLVGGTATVHAIAPSSASIRTYLGGLDPWLLAERTGGAKLVLPSNGVVDLNALGVADRVSEIVRLTFNSTSVDRAAHRIRIRVTAGGKVAELSPGLARYDIDPSLRRPRR